MNKQAMWSQGLTASAEVSRCRPQFSSCWRASALLLTLSTNFFIVARRWLGVQRVWALRSYQHHTCPDENTQTHQSPIYTSQKPHTLACAQNKELQHQSWQSKDSKTPQSQPQKLQSVLFLVPNLQPADHKSQLKTYLFHLAFNWSVYMCLLLLLWGYANCTAFVLIWSLLALLLLNQLLDCLHACKCVWFVSQLCDYV